MFTLPAGVSARAELVEKRSRFICTLVRADTEQQARAATLDVRSRFPDARHNCSAFIVAGQPPWQGPPRMHSSDDGEPAGTAGPPILEALQTSELVNACAVVTRYFGGVLLGTGGLVRAYSTATRMAVDEAPLVQIVQLESVEVTVPAKHAGRMDAEVRRSGWLIQNATWDSDLCLRLAVAADQIEQVAALAAAITHAPARLCRLGLVSQEIPATCPSQG